MESEFPNFSLNFDFENLENETLNKRVKKKAEEELGKSIEDLDNTICSTTYLVSMASTER